MLRFVVGLPALDMFLYHYVCRLASRAGVRPMALSFDDLDRSWATAANALQIAFPSLVRRRFISRHNPMTQEDHDFLAAGGIILDKDHFEAHGVFLGQDPLHVYFRLVESIEWRSWDACFAMRCARKLLQGWAQVESQLDDHVRAELEEHHDAMEWLQLRDEAADDCGVDAILRSYFRGSVLPRNAGTVLLQQRADLWQHPDSGHALPLCAKAVVLEDLLRKESPARLRAEARDRDCFTFCFSLNYPRLAFAHPAGQPAGAQSVENRGFDTPGCGA